MLLLVTLLQKISHYLYCFISTRLALSLILTPLKWNSLTTWHPRRTKAVQAIILLLAQNDNSSSMVSSYTLRTRNTSSWIYTWCNILVLLPLYALHSWKINIPKAGWWCYKKERDLVTFEDYLMHISSRKWFSYKYSTTLLHILLLLQYLSFFAITILPPFRLIFLSSSSSLSFTKTRRHSWKKKPQQPWKALNSQLFKAFSL